MLHQLIAFATQISIDVIQMQIILLYTRYKLIKLNRFIGECMIFVLNSSHLPISFVSLSSLSVTILLT